MISRWVAILTFVIGLCCGAFFMALLIDSSLDLIYQRRVDMINKRDK